jgi:hypothetical protein
MSEKPENSEKPIKKSAIMTEEKKKQLALARVKAEEIAHQNRLVRQKEEQAKELAKKVRAEKAEKALQLATAEAEALKKPVTAPIDIPSEPIQEHIKPSIKKKKSARVVYVDSSSSSSDSDEEVVYVKRKSKSKYVKQYRPRSSENDAPISQPIDMLSAPVHNPHTMNDLSELMTASQLKQEMALMKRDMLRKSMFKGF